MRRDGPSPEGECGEFKPSFHDCLVEIEEIYTASKQKYHGFLLFVLFEFKPLSTIFQTSLTRSVSDNTGEIVRCT